MTRRLTKQETGRAMRLAGAGFDPAQIVDAVGCSFAQAQKIVRERSRRLREDSPLWSDRGDMHPPPEVRHDNRRTHA